MSTQVPRRPPLTRSTTSTVIQFTNLEESARKELGVNTGAYDNEVVKLRARVTELEEELSIFCQERGSGMANFRLQAIADDDSKVAFYTGFPSYAHLKVCFNFLGLAVNHLYYKESISVTQERKKTRPRSLSALNEFFLL